MNPARSSISSNSRCLWFQRGELTFALPVSDLVEVREFPKLRPLPLSDPSLAGFVLFRERIVPVFDPLALAGGNTAVPDGPITVAIAAQGQQPSLGFVVSQIGKIISLPEQLEALEETALPAAFSGRAPQGEGTMLVLNAHGLSAAFELSAAA